MKKLLLTLAFLLTSSTVFGQYPSYYNAGRNADGTYYGRGSNNNRDGFYSSGVFYQAVRRPSFSYYDYGYSYPYIRPNFYMYNPYRNNIYYLPYRVW